MSITLPAPAQTAEQLEQEVGNELGDELLLNAARASKVAKVPAGIARSTARAWSISGRVD